MTEKGGSWWKEISITNTCLSTPFNCSKIMNSICCSEIIFTLYIWLNLRVSISYSLILKSMTILVYALLLIVTLSNVDSADNDLLSKRASITVIGRRGHGSGVSNMLIKYQQLSASLNKSLQHFEQSEIKYQQLNASLNKLSQHFEQSVIKYQHLIASLNKSL